ncbi:MAG TPA: hypothetical protein VMV41_08100 [Cellulomonadaceae bacterium]|nr:hypothetical protein [Cellulomonadaceae bacterium]
MLTRTEIERLAAAGNQLRPDWPVRSLVTLIHTNLANRAYRDVAVALAWIATDPNTATPGRLLELGPWWTASRIAGTTGPDSVPRPTDPRCPIHEWERASNCRACKAEALAAADTEHAATTPDHDPDRADTYARGRRIVDAALARHRASPYESG